MSEPSKTEIKFKVAVVQFNINQFNPRRNLRKMEANQNTNVQSTAINLYRFSSKKEEVNWDSRYRGNKEFNHSLTEMLVDTIPKYIKKVTYDERNLRAVVPVSGGLDSSVVADLVAQSMYRARHRGLADSASLVLLAFHGVSEEDFEYSRKFSTDLMKKFPGTNMRIFLAEMDLNPLMQQISRGTNRVIERINTHMCYPGELATRLISLVNLEFADRIGHCAVGTTNGTEIVLGEFVIGAANECEPIADIYKSQVFDIGEILGISRYILERNPINSTFGTDKIHTYFAEIPDGLDARAVYSVLDPVVHHLFDLKLEPSEVARRLGHSKSFVDKVARRIRNQDHRRRIPFFCLEDKIETTKSSIESIPQEDVSAEFRKMYSCQ